MRWRQRIVGVAVLAALAPTPAGTPAAAAAERAAAPTRHSSDGVVGPTAPMLRGDRRAEVTGVSAYDVGPGVRLRQWTRTDRRGAVRLHLLMVDLDEPGISLSHLAPPYVRQRARVRRMAVRAEAVAAVNGDFFDIHDTGAPLGVGVADRRLRHAPLVGWTNVVMLRRGRVPAIGPAVLRARIAGHPELPVVGVNSPTVAPHGIVAYTPGWGRTAGRRVLDGIRRRVPTRKVVVRGGIVRENASRLDSGRLVRELVLVGRGDGARALRRLGRGEKVRLRARVLSRPRLALGGSVVLLEAGRLGTRDDRELHPRTAIGVDRDGRRLLLLVADGRSAASRGLTLEETARLLRKRGAEDALNLDGGGSSTMVAAGTGGRLRVRNEPSGGRQRRVPNGLAVHYAAPQASATVSRRTVSGSSSASP